MNNESALLLYKKLVQATCIPRKINNLFSYTFYKNSTNLKVLPWLKKDVEKRQNSSLEVLTKEFKRLGFKENIFKISSANENFE